MILDRVYDMGNEMKKINLKKLSTTALLMILALDYNYTLSASKQNIMTGRSREEVKEILELRKQQKSDVEILKILNTKKQQQEEQQLKSLNEKFGQLSLSTSSAEQEQKIKNLEEENRKLKEEKEQVSSGKSIPQGVALNAADIGRLQDENKKLTAALEGFQENSPTYKNLKEQLERVQKELALAKGSKSPGGFPPIPSSSNQGSTPPKLPPMMGQPPKMGMPPQGPMQGPPVPVQKSPEEIAQENNAALIKAIDDKIVGFEKEVDSNPTISSAQNKEHLKLLLREFFELLKTYAQEHPEVPGAKKIVPNLNTFVGLLGFTASLTEIEKAQSKEANTERLPAFIEKLNDYIKKTEDFIHTTKGNPFELPEKGAQNFALRNVLIPLKGGAQQNLGDEAPKKPQGASKATSTVKDTIGFLLGIGPVSSENPKLTEKVSEALKHYDPDKGVSEILKLKADGISELKLLEDAKLTKESVDKLWNSIPSSIKEAKVKDLQDALALPGVKGLAGEVDFNNLLKKNNILPANIGLATEESDKATALFRDDVLRPFVVLKLVSEIVTAYRSGLGGNQDDQIAGVQSKIGALKTLITSASQGSSPLKEQKIKGYQDQVKQLEEQIAKLEEEKKKFDEPIQVSNAIILKLESVFTTGQFVMPKSFKDFLDSELGKNIKNPVKKVENHGDLGDQAHQGNAPEGNKQPVVVSHDTHLQKVLPYKHLFDTFVGVDGKFTLKGAERNKHVFASLLELPADKFIKLNASQEKSIVTIAALETPDVIEALIYHMAQSKSAFENNPAVQSLTTQLEAVAAKLRTTPIVIAESLKKAHEQTLVNARGQVGGIVLALKK